MSEWKEKYLGDCISVSSGESLSEVKMKHGSYLVYGGNGFIGFHNSYLFVPEKLIIGRVGAQCGNVHITKSKSWITDNALIVNFLNDDDDSLFWFYLLSNSKLRSYAYESAQPVITGGIISRIKTKIPSPATQRKIAKILSSADSVIANTQVAIAKYKAIKQGMLNDLFTRGIDIKTGKLRPSYADAPELYKESALGWIPLEWEDKYLSSLCSEKPTYGINAAAVDYTHQLPTYLRITDIDEDGNFSKTRKKCVDSPFSNQYILKKGDLVFARTGATVGKTYLYNESDGLLVFAGFLIKVSPNENLLDSNFLKFLTETPYYLNWVELMSQRSGQPGINGNEYANFLVPKPNLMEQKTITERLLSIQNKISVEQQYLQKLQQLKTGLMADLLSGKKKVEEQ